MPVLVQRYRVPLAALARPHRSSAEPVDWSSAGSIAGYLERIGAQLVTQAEFSDWFAALRARVWLDRVAHGYGDLEVLGFLTGNPSRADLEQHVERLPESARPFAWAKAVVCLSAREGIALRAAMEAAQARRYAKLPWHLRGSEAKRHAAFYAPAPEEGFLEVFLALTHFGLHQPESLAPQRGPPMEISAPPILGMGLADWVTLILLVIAVFLLTAVPLGLVIWLLL
ncbi:hypothetical protein P2318_17585 [Myxococcaceae bacterium GXIMD 01537]